MQPRRSVAPQILHVLVVENHEDTQQSLIALLRALGHRAMAVTTVAAGLEALAAEEFDVLISDIGLPDGDGWGLLRHAHPTEPVYAIAMSGFGMVADRAKSAAAGYRHHLLKPFEPKALKAMLEEAVNEKDGR